MGVNLPNLSRYYSLASLHRALLSEKSVKSEETKRARRKKEAKSNEKNIIIFKLNLFE